MIAAATGAHSVFAQDGLACAQEIEWESPLLEGTFRRSINKSSIDFLSSEDGFQRKTIDTEELLQQVTSSTRTGQQNGPGAPWRVKIFSINSDFSNGPLSVSLPTMKILLQNLNVNVHFAEIIAAFGEKPRRSEAGLDCFFSHLDPTDNCSFEVMYLYRFAELIDPALDTQWTLRQIGVYHQHNVATREDSFIFLQPHAQSQLDIALQEIEGDSFDIGQVCADPMKLHQLLFHTYFSVGWRGYLHHMSQDFTQQSDHIFTEDIVKNEGVTYHTLRDWRDLADRTAPVTAMLESLQRILHGLQNLETQIQTAQSPDPVPNPKLRPFLQSQLSLSKGLLRSAEVFRSRVDGVIGLLSNTIEMKNQHSAAILNNRMQRLTKETVDDSANVKIVTVLSLIYLPASFLATLFGMDFFNFDAVRKRISVTHDFWIFFVILIPLMVSTLGSWFVMYRRQKKRRLRSGDEMRLAVRG